MASTVAQGRPHSRTLPFFGAEAFTERLAGLDLAQLCVALEATFRRHGARTQDAPLPLRIRHAGPLRTIASFVLESDRVMRVVVSHVRVSPFFAAVALVVHPRPEVDAPLLVADLVLAPPGFARAYLDACGPAIRSASFASRFREPLAAILDKARHVRRTTVPAWMAPLSGGGGGRVRAAPGRGSIVSRLLVDYVDRYLLALGAADEAADAAANRACAGAVRDAVRSHGAAARHLARAFGPGFANEYLEMMWGA
jgi:hypothetical protein